MTPKLAVKRLRYLIALAKKHAPAHLPAVRREVARAIRYVRKMARAVAV
jgi:RNase P subunit RPR2